MAKPKLTKYNPCHCGSGLFYKDCHKSIDEAPPALRLDAAHTQYRSNWVENSTHFDTSGAYDWMASKLKVVSPQSVLDIGAGTGEGLMAVLRAYNSKIVSVDENRACLQAARDKLLAAGVGVSVSERLRFTPVHDRLHRLEVLPGMLAANAQVSLLEADWLADDEEMFGFLETLPRFDAMTVWLIGTHSLRQQSFDVLRKGPKSAGEYRLFVQNKAYEIADKLLRSGGVLQIVDRGEALETDALVADRLRGHREQASVTSLKMFDIDQFSYTEPDVKGRIKMEVTKGTSGRIGQSERLAMISTLARKP